MTWTTFSKQTFVGDPTTIRLSSDYRISINGHAYPQFQGAQRAVLAYDEQRRIAIRPARESDRVGWALTLNGGRGMNYSLLLRGISKLLGHQPGTVFAATIDGDMLVLTPPQQQD